MRKKILANQTEERGDTSMRMNGIQLWGCGANVCMYRGKLMQAKENDCSQQHGSEGRTLAEEINIRFSHKQKEPSVPHSKERGGKHRMTSFTHGQLWSEGREGEDREPYERQTDRQRERERAMSNPSKYSRFIVPAPVMMVVVFSSHLAISPCAHTTDPIES